MSLNILKNLFAHVWFSLHFIKAIRKIAKVRAEVYLKFQLGILCSHGISENFHFSKINNNLSTSSFVTTLPLIAKTPFSSNRHHVHNNPQ